MSRTSNLILRMGVAFALLYPSLDAIKNPESWLGYVPQFVLQAVHTIGLSDLAFLHLFGVLEFVLALWILSGRRLLWPTATAAFILIAIVLANLTQFEVLFRDVAIAAAAASLAIEAYNKRGLRPLQ